MHVASIYVLIPVQNIAEIFATLYSALYSASVFCTGMSTYIMPGSKKTERNRVLKQNREAGIGDETGRIPVRVKDAGTMLHSSVLPTIQHEDWA